MATQELDVSHFANQQAAELLPLEHEPTLIRLVDILHAEAFTDDEHLLASSASAHTDFFMQKWRIHLEESLHTANESKKRFPTLHGFSFMQWASHNGPTPTEKRGQEQFVKPRLLGREIVNNGQLILPTVDFINRVLQSINAINEDQDVVQLADEARKNGYKTRRWMEYTKPPLSLPCQQGDVLLVDVDRKSVDLLMPISKLPLLTGFQHGLEREKI